ncbi:hypothetical protein ACFE04_007865 [Oxalis oulophora]
MRIRRIINTITLYCSSCLNNIQNEQQQLGICLYNYSTSSSTSSSVAIARARQSKASKALHDLYRRISQLGDQTVSIVPILDQHSVQILSVKKHKLIGIIKELRYYRRYDHALHAGGVQAGGAQAGEVQAGGAQAGGVQAGEAQAGGAQAGDVQAGGAQVGDVQAGGVQAGGAQAGEVQAGGAHAGGGQAGDVQAGGAQVGDVQVGGVQAGGCRLVASSTGEGSVRDGLDPNKQGKYKLLKTILSNERLILMEQRGEHVIPHDDNSIPADKSMAPPSLNIWSIDLGLDCPCNMSFNHQRIYY